MFGQVGLEQLGYQLHVKFRGEKEREGRWREGREGWRERERDRQTDRQTDAINSDRDKHTERKRR